MPNHIYNTVTITGDPEIVKLLDKAVRTDDEQSFDFNRVIPRPPIVDDVCSGLLSADVVMSNRNRNWHDWQTANWGTKWNAYELGKPGDGIYKFCTAWSPPFPVIRTLSKLFPELELELSYDDEGDGFSGRMTFKNGRSKTEKHIE